MVELGQHAHSHIIPRLKILFSALPLESSGNLDGLGKIYAYAMKQANVAAANSTQETDPGILICPTEYANATLYVLTSETATKTVSFTMCAVARNF